MKKISVFLILSAMQAVLCAQNVHVEVSLDSTMCVIGGQVGLNISVAHPNGVELAFPYLKDTLNADVEVLGRSAIDTVNGDDKITERITYTLTCFEDSLYALPRVPLVLNNETVWTEPLTIRFVQPFEIDTTQIAITDIKPPYNPPFYWKGYAMAALLLLCIIGLIVAAYFLLRKFFAKEVVIEKIPPQVRRRNAYDVAMTQLNRIKEEKRWQHHGQQKQYHSELTETVRQYIDDVYDMGCMEMPTSEILSDIKNRLADNAEAFRKLSAILTIADLVKFAKYEAMPDENENVLNNAYSFIELTKPAPETEETPEGAANQQEQNS